MSPGSQSDAAHWPSSVGEILAITDAPVVCIDQESFFTYVNECFETTYGWSGQELLGRSVTTIMPEHMRNAHMLGFSRFVVTEKTRVMGQPLQLSIMCKDGKIKDMELFILGDKQGSTWQFAATLKPRESK